MAATMIATLKPSQKREDGLYDMTVGGEPQVMHSHEVKSYASTMQELVDRVNFSELMSFQVFLVND